MTDDALNELGRRLAASWASYMRAHKNVDRMLRQTPDQIGEFWKEMARLIFLAYSYGSANSRELDDLKLKDVLGSVGHPSDRP